ncbi:MAG: methyltransferase domain-containing protein [Candidatus Magasanikbacteria bacterium]|nr:methyltransferase domain-containing protein [Candidatus Magasanikbacteria bacterium]
MVHAGKALIDPHFIFTKIGLGPGMRVADFGCGRTGHFIFSAARAVGERGVVYAVDIVKNILESLKSRVRSEGYDNIQLVWSNVEASGKTPIPPASLDVCFMVNLMFLLHDRAGAMTEAARLLKSGGQLVVVEWEKPLGAVGPTPGQLVAAEQILPAAETRGLSLADHFAAGEYHYCLVFKKNL